MKSSSFLNALTILLLAASCSRHAPEAPKKSEAQDPIITEDIPQFSIQIDSFTNASSDPRAIIQHAKDGTPISLQDALAALRSRDNHTALASKEKENILWQLKNSATNTKNFSEVKQLLFSLYSKRGDIQYNSESTSLYDLDKNPPALMATSATWNLWNAYLEVNPQALQKKNLVNIYTNGHILPGEIIFENGSPILYGYESLTSRESTIHLGDVRALNFPIRIIDLKYDLVLYALHSYLSSKDYQNLRSEVLYKTAKQYGLPLKRLENSIAKLSLIKGIRWSSVSLFAFGENASQTNSHQLPITDKTPSLSNYQESFALYAPPKMMQAVPEKPKHEEKSQQKPRPQPRPEIKPEPKPEPQTPLVEEQENESPGFTVTSSPDEEYENYDDNSLLYIEAYRSALAPEAPNNLAISFLAEKSWYDEDNVNHITLGLCNGFLVGKDLYVTAAHCIEKLDRQRPCHQQIYIRIKTSDGSTLRSCRKILFDSGVNRSDEATNFPDYALIQLDNPVNTGNYFSIARAGVSSTNEIYVHSFDITRNKYGNFFGFYKKQSCKTIPGIDLMNYADFPIPGLDKSPEESQKKIGRSRTIPLANYDENSSCAVLGGNSGSLVSNTKDQAVGVAQAAVSAEEMERQKFDVLKEAETFYQNKGYASHYDLQWPTSLWQEFFIVTNFTCLKFSHPPLDANYSDYFCKNYFDTDNPFGYSEQRKKYRAYLRDDAIITEIEKRIGGDLNSLYPNVKFTIKMEPEKRIRGYIKHDRDLSLLNPERSYANPVTPCFTGEGVPPKKLSLPVYELYLQDRYDEYFVFSRTLLDVIKLTGLSIEYNYYNGMPRCQD